MSFGPLKTLSGKFATAVVTGTLFLAGGPNAAAATATPAQFSPAAASAASTTSTTSMLQRWPVLRQGPNSIWPQVTVRSLQYLLRARGTAIPVSGTFGLRTRAAVVAFQRSRGLIVDGVVGAQTWRSLIITVSQGSRGDAVRAVQDQINFRNLRDGRTLVVDGIYGQKTRRAVIGFQQGLAFDIKPFAVDGVVGPMTWPALVNGALSG